MDSPALEDAQAEQTVEVVLEAGGDQGVAHLSERVDGTCVGRGHGVGIDQLVLEPDVLADKVSTERSTTMRSLFFWNHSPPPGGRVAVKPVRLALRRTCSSKMRATLGEVRRFPWPDSCTVERGYVGGEGAMVLRVTLVSATLLAGSLSVAQAATSGSTARMATVNFHLRVTSAPPQQMTFWVAYGPPEPTFGVVRLHRVGKGEYAGSRALPVGARASFTYLAGWGVINTKGGPMPGDPVVTIKRTRSLPIGSAPVPMIVWSGPAG